jgi:hypothetical protein
MKPLAWLIFPQVLIGSLASWYYDACIGFGLDQMIVNRVHLISMGWIDGPTLAFLLFSTFVIRRQLLASRVRPDVIGKFFRVATLSLLITGLFLCVLILWAFIFVPGVPNSFPPWSTGTTLWVTFHCIAVPSLIVAGFSFAASFLYGLAQRHGRTTNTTREFS